MRRRALVLAGLFAALQTCLLTRTAFDTSHTADEGVHLAAAATLWANHDFRFNCEAPVLPKWAFAAAVRAVDPLIGTTPAGWTPPFEHILLDRPLEALRRDLVAARIATIMVVVGAGLLLWVAASRFGMTAAIVTHALWCFSPTVLANGSLATLDAWSAALVCTGIWSAMRLRERPTHLRSALLGAILAGAAATKVTTLGTLPIAAVLLLGTTGQSARPAASALGRMVAFAVGFLLTLWALYGFSVGRIDFADPCAWSERGAASLHVRPGRVLATLLASVTLPFPAWWEGLAFQIDHAEAGHLGYLFGEVRNGGWWWFYVACLAFKVTIAAQVLAALAVVGLGLVRDQRSRKIDAVILAYPLLLVAVMSAARHQGSIAFLLPAFPLVMLWLGASVESATHAYGRRAQALALLLLVLGTVESLRVHPHHLMFYNLWAGGPEGGPRYLVLREDWGQDKRRLAAWQHERGVARLYYASYGFGAESWGVVYDPVPCEPRLGVYALHAAEVHRPRFSLRPGCIDWLTVEPPDERIGYSIYIYEVDDRRLARLAAARDTSTPFWRSAR